MALKWFENGDIESFLEHRTEFYDMLVPTVWSIMTSSMSDSSEGDAFEGDASEDASKVDASGDASEGEYKGGSGVGFCVHESGLLLTCAHVIPPNPYISLENAKNRKSYGGKVVGTLKDWDIALIQVEVEESENFDYVRLADDADRIFCGQEVHSIGDPDGLKASFLTGFVSYPFEGYDPWDMVMNFNMNEEYIHGAYFFKPFLLHRTPCTILNSYGNNTLTNPNIPFIQISKFLSVSRASGSPIFNNRGSVIGMIQASIQYETLAIHYCALKKFIHLVRPNLFEDDTSKTRKRNNFESKKEEDSSKRSDKRSKKRRNDKSQPAEVPLEASKRLHLKEHTVLDGSGNAFNLAAPVECKGIVGSDDRQNLLDLMGVKPHDANCTGSGSRFCILRPELMSAFCHVEAAKMPNCGSPLEQGTSVVSDSLNANSAQTVVKAEEHAASATNDIQIPRHDAMT